MINEKYGELLQEITQIIAAKDFENEQLEKEINRLRNQLHEIERNKENEQKRS